MSVRLPDANVLTALFDADHVHHDVAELIPASITSA
jgi:predicted nucleic acid-binding protein